jgi:hypothetical protein
VLSLGGLPLAVLPPPLGLSPPPPHEISMLVSNKRLTRLM